MIDAVEPLSVVLWGLFLLAAGMYPLGILLPCSTCCGQCDDVVEFNRCIRFVNTNTSSPPTSYHDNYSASTPLHGFSRAVTRPEQIGAKLVPTRISIACGTTVDGEAASMSNGDSRTSVYRLYYESDTGADIGTVLTWRVTLVGVTRPPSPPSSLTMPSAYTMTYGIGNKSVSSSSTPAVSVYACQIQEGGQWIDGSTVTGGTLSSMLSLSLASDPTVFLVRATFTKLDWVFQYVPVHQSVVLRYVIKHSRGGYDRFTEVTVTIPKYYGMPASSIPDGGFQPVVASVPEYSDTPFTPRTPSFYGSTLTGYFATIYSDSTGLVGFPELEFLPVGPELNAARITAQAAEGQYLRQSFLNSYNNVLYTTLKRGWIIRPDDPLSGTSDNSRNQWNYDVDAVESFLSGEITLPYSSAGTLLTSLSSTSWTMRVSEPAAVCGYDLCGYGTSFITGVAGSYKYWYPMFGDTIAKTAVFSYPEATMPQTSQTSDEKGTTTYTNLCYGQDSLGTMALRLSPQGCSYTGNSNSCQISSSGGTLGSLALSQRFYVRQFYCGDLLWAIENGPCRQSITHTGNDWTKNGTVTLGGDDDRLWAGDWMCPDIVGGHRGTPKYPNGKCPPLEVSVDIKHDIIFGNGYATTSNAFRISGTLRAGVHAVQLVNESQTPSYFFADCNSQNYSTRATDSSGFTPGSATSALFGVLRSRSKWCDPWGEWTFNYIQPGSFGVFSVAYHPVRVIGSGYQVYTPVVGTDFDVTYEEIDPVATAVSPQHVTIPKEGGTATLTRCCPQRTQTVTLPATDRRYARTILVEADQPVASTGVQQVTRGATAYVTQSGYNDSECRFDIIWLSGSYSITTLSAPITSGGVRQFKALPCPIIGQVSPAEQPECLWSATTSASWLVATQTSDGLLKLSVDDSAAAVYAPIPWLSFFLGRYATVTVTLSGTSKTWTIVQIQT